MNNEVENLVNVELPSVSVIIPCYNSSAFIKRAVNCVFNQTFTDWELILVNNNSTDDTQQILEQYRQSYPQKIKLFMEREPGAPAARNKGLNEASGKWIQFLDADDELLPDKIGRQYEIAMRENPAVIASPYIIKGIRDNKPFKTIRKLEIKDHWLGLIRSRLGITSSNLWRKELLLKVGGWDESLVSSQEYDLMFRVLQVLPKVGLDSNNSTIINIESGTSVSRGGGNDRGLKILESRIGLRIRIKEYLETSGLLTRDRAYYLDGFIYWQLILNYRSMPEYVSGRLETLKLKIKFDLRLKGMCFMFKMDLKRALGLIKTFKVN